MQKSGLSIVVPVYNTGGYLSKCLESIYSHPTFSEFEVIIVDDGSSDNSVALALEWCEKHKNITLLIHGENKRLSIARNTGLGAAKYKYIWNVDPDDYALPGAIDTIVKTLDSTAADIVVFPYFRETKRKCIVHTFGKNGIYTGLNKNVVLKNFTGAIWSKAFRRDIIQGLIVSKVGVNSTEDLCYLFEVFMRANKIAICENPIYVYCHNPSSLSVGVKSVDYIGSQVLVQMIMNQIREKYATKFIDANWFYKYWLNKVCVELFLYQLSEDKSKVVHKCDQYVRVLLSQMGRNDLGGDMILRCSKSGIGSILIAIKIQGIRFVISIIIRQIWQRLTKKYLIN